ncbi:unnamed protein product [Rhodiola kirilowii]
MSTTAKCTSIILALLFFISVLSDAKPPRNGFTLDLVHRDSPNSPLYDPKHSDYTQIQTAISRSIARAKRFSTVTLGLDLNSADPEGEIISVNGEYVMNVSIGTPPFPVLAIADTGSDLIWTQCKPCSNCYDQTAPLFDSTKSSTFKTVSCSSPPCTTGVSGFNPSCVDSKCQYSVSYGDQSTSNGAIATETFTLGSSTGSPVRLPNTVFGCGFDNQGTFSASGSGIIGLGNGPDSLIGQLDKSISGKFSYCLVPHSSKRSKSSAINFGANAVVSGKGVVSTPLVAKDPATYYWLTLEAITIGKERVAFTGSSGDVAEKGNIIIDSGTTLLILPDDFYASVEAELEKQVDAKRVDNPSQQPNLCFDAAEFKAPEIEVNFEGANVKLNDYNAWVAVADDVVCFAAAGSDIGIYGNLAQMNFLVGYDKQRMKVSFKPADCTHAA